MAVLLRRLHDDVIQGGWPDLTRQCPCGAPRKIVRIGDRPMPPAVGLRDPGESMFGLSIVVPNGRWAGPRLAGFRHGWTCLTSSVIGAIVLDDG